MVGYYTDQTPNSGPVTYTLSPKTWMYDFNPKYEYPRYTAGASVCITRLVLKSRCAVSKSDSPFEIGWQFCNFYFAQCNFEIAKLANYAEHIHTRMFGFVTKCAVSMHSCVSIKMHSLLYMQPFGYRTRWAWLNICIKPTLPPRIYVDMVTG